VTVTLPDAPFTWASGSGQRVEVDADPAVLLALAVAYHTAQYRLASTSESAARDLFLRLRPINNADMGEWMAAWNRLLGAQQKQQSQLTAAYIRSTLGQYGIALEQKALVDDVALGDLESMMGGKEFRLAPAPLRADIMDAARRLGKGLGTVDDRLLADRALNLASPVIKVRTGTSVGMSLDEALDSVLPEVEDMTFNANRAAERLAMEATRWPTFKNGKAMLYRRIVTPGACGWCITVATRLYPAESGKGSATWHRGCRCTWQLVTFDHAKTYLDTLRKNEGDYFAAAESVGMWRGDAPASTAEFIRATRATTDGSPQ
jgi:hypothetical protein